MLNWNNIDTVFLDMDGTLLDLHFDNHFWLTHVPLRYSEKHSMSIQAAKDHIFPRMRELKGQLEWYSIDFWTNELGLPIIALKQEVSSLIRLRPKVEHFLQYLQAAHKTVILFTNAHLKTVELKMDQADLSPYFDHIVTSHQLGLAKEQSGAWEKLAQQLTFDPARSLFIDDNFDVLRAAQQYNIAHLLGITLPDLRGQSLSSDEFRLLHCFSEITPENSSS